MTEAAPKVMTRAALHEEASGALLGVDWTPVGGTGSMLVRTRPWESILRFYRDLAEGNMFFRPMARLVAHIALRPYAPLLFATTSMHTLLVAQHAEIELGHDVLGVERDPNGKGVRFTLRERPFAKPATWECSEEEIVETFEGFLRTAKWVDVS